MTRSAMRGLVPPTVRRLVLLPALLSAGAAVLLPDVLWELPARSAGHFAERSGSKPALVEAALPFLTRKPFAGWDHVGLGGVRGD